MTEPKALVDEPQQRGDLPATEFELVEIVEEDDGATELHEQLLGFAGAYVARCRAATHFFSDSRDFYDVRIAGAARMSLTTRDDARANLLQSAQRMAQAGEDVSQVSLEVARMRRGRVSIGDYMEHGFAERLVDSCLAAFEHKAERPENSGKPSPAAIKDLTTALAETLYLWQADQDWAPTVFDEIDVTPFRVKQRAAAA